MANVNLFFRSFSGGEITPEMYGRLDDAKFQTGLALCQNYIIAPHGPAMNRPGTRLVRRTKFDDRRSRVLPFAYSVTQTMILEFGDRYIRFHTQGQTLLVGAPPAWDALTAYSIGATVTKDALVYYAKQPNTGVAPPDPANWYAVPSDAYEVPTDYLEEDLFDIHYVQSADVLTLVHPRYPPRELRREGVGGIRWVLRDIKFTSNMAAPTGVSATAHVPSGATGLVDHKYVVTALGAEITDEGPQSVTVTCSNNLFALGAYNDVAWTAVAGASRYNVYKLDNGLYGFVGQTPNLTFRDDNITPDLSQTPPEGSNPFDAPGDYPAAVSYFEQRRAFAGTLNRPQNLWLTRSGTESLLTYSIPSRDDDAISFRVAAREANTIRHLAPLNDLLLLTSSAEWRVSPVNSDALTPSTVSVRPQAYIGASNVQPVIVNTNMIYAASRGGHAREMAYSNEGGGYVTGDLCLRAPHLFDGRELTDMALAKSPLPVVWMTNSRGILLGLTYVPEQQVGAWHWHDTQGLFESVAAVAEGAEDAAYFVVQRTINGVQRRFIERMAHRVRADEPLADAYFVDCGLSYDGVPQDEFSGLDHLEGEQVSILGDGAVFPRQTVVGGKVTLSKEVAKAHIGLPYAARLRSLPAAYEAPGFGQGVRKNVNKVHLRVAYSSAIKAGPSPDRLTEYKQRTTEPPGTPPAPVTSIIEIVLDPTWTNHDGQVYVEQTDPLPLTVVALAAQVAVGGN